MKERNTNKLPRSTAKKHMPFISELVKIRICQFDGLNNVLGLKGSLLYSHLKAPSSWCHGANDIDDVCTQLMAACSLKSIRSPLLVLYETGNSIENASMPGNYTAWARSSASGNAVNCMDFSAAPIWIS